MEAAGTGGFLAAGLLLDHSVVMTTGRVREPAHLNREAEIRPLAGDGDWRQAAHLRCACFAGGDEDAAAFCRRRAERSRALTEAGHGAWFGAFLRGRLAAQLGVVWGPARDDGMARYQDVATDPAQRRQGLAGTLVYLAGRHALERAGARTLVIVADPRDGAARLYHSAGFAARESQVGLYCPPAAPGSAAALLPC